MDNHIAVFSLQIDHSVRPDHFQRNVGMQLSARSNSPDISAFVPSVSEAALKVAVAQGMRLTFPMLLMSNRQFGDWASYMPRNPGFM